MDFLFYKQALNNKKCYLEKHNGDEDKINFVCTLAEKYEIQDFIFICQLIINYVLSF
ncbi:hypothetical protein [uncultured Clostridium sp.]|uniref:hypothetical protein n=1 Tax=uncultured Clostridium sp. TaxID=59620 RepID=UPI0028EC3B53|nr:hypothetical protein [uncultured Clostridium sp.]